MTAFDHDDTHEAAQLRVPDGMIDVTYDLLVEAALIDELDRNLTNGAESARWMSADPAQLPHFCNVPMPRSSDDEQHTSLALGSLIISSVLIGLVHEDSSTGLLKHLARLNDKLDAADDESFSIDYWYILSQLVFVCNPSRQSSRETALVRIMGLVYNDDQSVDVGLAFELAKYLMLVSFSVIHGDDPDLRRYLVDQLREAHRERAADTSVPYFESDDDTVESC